MNIEIKKWLKKAVCAALVVGNIVVLPVCADNSVSQILRYEDNDQQQARWNNIGAAVLSVGFRADNTGYFGISITPYRNICTGFDGQLILYDENGGFLKSWAISDFESPYDQERSYQCEDGKTYTIRFQGYAYGNGTMFDEIDLSVTDTCE